MLMAVWRVRTVLFDVELMTRLYTAPTYDANVLSRSTWPRKHGAVVPAGASLNTEIFKVV